MNEQEIKILNEIIDNMDKLLTEKKKEYQDTWKLADMTYLKVKLAQQVNQLFLPSFYDKDLRTLTHVFNYAFFLYYRYKQHEVKPFKLT